MNTELNAASACKGEFGTGATTLDRTEARFDKHLVHKSSDENVFVSHIEPVQSPGPIAPTKNDLARQRTDHFRVVLRIKRDHPLFFDRDRGHVHAICFMEAAQQSAMAVAHLFYGVPLDVEFVTTECSAQFLSVANIDDPLIADQTVSDHVYRRGRLIRMHTALVIRQGSLERARLAGTIILLKKQQLKYLEECASAADPAIPITLQPTGTCA